MEVPRIQDDLGCIVWRPRPAYSLPGFTGFVGLLVMSCGPWVCLFRPMLAVSVVVAPLALIALVQVIGMALTVTEITAGIHRLTIERIRPWGHRITLVDLLWEEIGNIRSEGTTLHVTEGSGITHTIRHVADPYGLDLLQEELFERACEAREPTADPTTAERARRDLRVMMARQRASAPQP